LSDPSTLLLGPFDFNHPRTNPPDRTPSFRQFLDLSIWHQLYALCIHNSIVPPILSMPTPTPTPT
jgi:hypothetical protein